MSGKETGQTTKYHDYMYSLANDNKEIQSVYVYSLVATAVHNKLLYQSNLHKMSVWGY